MDQVQKLLKEAQSVVVLTGAGISKESGVPTFRDPGGLWKKFRPEELATPEAFEKNPRLVWEWYEWRRARISPCKPNEAHQLLVQWEKKYPSFVLITQNVDGLHDRAGSQKILHLHGHIWELRCTKEQKVVENREVPLPELPPRCPCGALYRPNVVWFGEPIPEHILQRALQAAQSCDLMVVMGTSALVQPAASLPFLALAHGASVVEVNPQKTPLTPQATVHVPLTAVQFAREYG